MLFSNLGRGSNEVSSQFYLPASVQFPPRIFLPPLQRGSRPRGLGTF